MKKFLPHSYIILGLFAAYLDAQQLYSGNSVLDCNNTDKTESFSAFLYSCNGEKHFCQAFLIFRSQYKYNSATTISNLTSSLPLEIARINNMSASGVFPLNKEVIVPVNCCCSGKYYQANSSYIIQTVYDTYFTIANDTYQGLSTCDALIEENPFGILQLEPGLNLRVPLRCACPTANQTKQGVKYLLTYLITWGDNIPDLSIRFNVSASSVANANGFSEEDPTLYPFTTILIPLPTEPSSSQTRIYYPPGIPPPFTPVKRQHKSHRGIYIGIAIGSSLGVITCSMFMLFFHHRGCRFGNASQKNKEVMKMLKLPENILDNIVDADQVLKIYEFEELLAATENFSSHKRLGDSVYHGIVRGKLSAIKKMSKDVTKEVQILQKINHFNLITLYGACEQNGVCYLVYEFMKNGSLKEWLHQKSHPEIQSWNNRIRIAIDVANGLDYLHNFTTPAYVHKDINSSNILLNEDLRAKIVNFSFARSIDREENGNSSTECIQGTKGYLAPEYLEAGKVTPKIDVYAFGVVLLELVMGREAVFKQDGREVLLSEKILSTLGTDADGAALRHLIDPRMQLKHPLGYIIDQTEVAVLLFKLSAACLARESARRLSMAEVVATLMKIQLDVQNKESFSIE